MIWQEQQLRDDKSPLQPWEQRRELFREIDMLRDYLMRIRDQAQSHVDDKNPGWGRWATTLRLAKEALE